MQNTRRELGWLWGPVALALLALFTVSDADLVSTRGETFELSKYAVATLGMPLVAAVAGVWFSRRWPWLLVAGTLGVLVATTESHVHLTSSRPGIASIVGSLGTAGAVLVVLGALSAARDAALAALVVVVQLLGTVFLGLSWLSSPLRPAALEITLAGLAVAGAVLAVFAARTGKVPVESLDRRTKVVGTFAALLPVVVAVLGHLVGQPSAPVVAGVLLLAGATAIAIALGRGALLRIATAGLVLFAVAAPITLAIYMSAGSVANYAPAALVGVGVGLLAAQLRQPTVVAALACAVLAVLMVTVVELTGEYADVTQGGLGALVIGLAMAAVTSSAATAAPTLLHLRVLPVAFGLVLVGFADGLRQVVQPVLDYGRVWGQLPEAEYLPVWGLVLSVAAAALVVVAIVDRRAKTATLVRANPGGQS
ncbi:hypothetical protein AB0A63_32050 [Lentzea sp. NPDC042327]|uniref:hypothetical protein n=1 Tax=Lentzea sp. NPDC042327 TaxID=3154801 RepID=UPI0033F4D3CF